MNRTAIKDEYNKEKDRLKNNQESNLTKIPPHNEDNNQQTSTPHQPSQ